MAIEIVDLPSYNMVIFHSYVSLPEGTSRISPGLDFGRVSLMLPSGKLT